MRRLIVLAALVAGCGRSYGPRDITLTIGADPALSNAEVATITQLDISVIGGATALKTYPLGRPMKRTEKLVVHVPTSTGPVQLTALARDAQSLVALKGASAMVYFEGGDAHDATINLRPLAGSKHVVTGIDLQPASWTLFTGQTAQLGTGGGDAVTFKATDGGSVDANGVFSAPAAEGTYHVDVASAMYLSDKATVPVRVLANGIARWAGSAGGVGTTDGMGTAARINSPRGLFGDGKGNFYFAEWFGNTVRKLELGSATVSTIAGKADVPRSAEGTGSGATFNCPNSMAYDGADTIFVAESCSQVIRTVKVSTGDTAVLAGQRYMQGIMDGKGTAAQFRWPTGLAYDPVKKLLYVGEDLAHTIRTVNPSDGQVTTVAGTANMPGFKDGAIAGALFNNPSNLLVDPAGGLYIFDANNQRLRRWDFGSNMVSTILTDYNANAMVLDTDGNIITSQPLRKVTPSGTVTRLQDDQHGDIWDWLQSVSLLPDGSLLLGANNAILRRDAATGALSTVAGFWEQWGETDGPRTSARMSSLSVFTVRSDGTVFARDDRLRKIDADGNVSTVIQVNGPFAGGWDGGMVFGPDGALYACDRNRATIVRTDVDTGVHTVFVGAEGMRGYKDDIGAAARLNQPADITAYNGKLYFIEEAQVVVREVDIASKNVATIAGTPNMCGDADGTGPGALFCGVHGIVADGKGSLYVAMNSIIRKIDIASKNVITIAGTKGMDGFKDGPPGTGQLWWPNRMALDAAGKYLYVSEIGTTAIRRIDVATGEITTLAGGPSKSQAVEGALPGQVNQVLSLGFLPSGELLASVPRESAILQIRLP